MKGRVALWEGRHELRKEGLRGGSGGPGGGKRNEKREKGRGKRLATRPQGNPHRTSGWSDRKLPKHPLPCAVDTCLCGPLSVTGSTGLQCACPGLPCPDESDGGWGTDGRMNGPCIGTTDS